MGTVSIILIIVGWWAIGLLSVAWGMYLEVRDGCDITFPELLQYMCFSIFGLITFILICYLAGGYAWDNHNLSRKVIFKGKVAEADRPNVGRE